MGEVKNKPYFYINGYNFKIGTDTKSKSGINLIKNKMYVPGKNWGYTDIQWTNFSGEELTLNIFSRIYDEYTGDPAQPLNGGISTFYDEKRTPHAVLKYWAQNFVPCVIKTNLQAYESGTYVIDEIAQHNPHYDFIVTSLTLLQFERPGEIEQTYWTAEKISESTASMNAQTYEVSQLGPHIQNCSCTVTTPKEECTASFNPEVEIIQKYLQQWGYFPSYSYNTGKITVNGRFCYWTTQALRRFQEDRGIEVSGDFNDITRSHFMRKLEGI